MNIKFGAKVVRRGDSNKTEMLVTNVSTSGHLVGCIWQRIGEWYSEGRFTAEELDVVGEYEPVSAHAMHTAYQQG